MSPEKGLFFYYKYLNKSSKNLKWHSGENLIVFTQPEQYP
jgi:hypothetical protein